MATTTLRRASGSARFAPLALLLLLWFLGDSCVVFAQRWREEPGRWEFTGKMVVRPLQVEHWMERGFTREQAQALYARAVAYTVDTLGEHVYRYHERMDEYWFNVPPGRSENDIGEQLIETGYYRYVCPNWKTFPQGALSNVCPNDEDFGEQWHHTRIESCAAWQIHTSGHDDVVIGFVDSGMRVSHEDLSDLDEFRRVGYNVETELWEGQGGNINDTVGHGTRVLGIAAATGNNTDGVSGVGWSLRHRMLKNGLATAQDDLACFWVSAEAGDRVICSTAGSPYHVSSTWQLYADNTAAIGEEYPSILIVHAAGNRYDYPPYDPFPDMITVGGTDKNDERFIENEEEYYGSVVGAMIDVMAPAVDIFTTKHTANDAYGVPGGPGTSYATPQVAALCALIWSYDPDLTASQVEALLYAGCDETADYDPDLHGYGRINAFNSLALASGSLWTRDPHPGLAGEDNIFKAAGAESGRTIRFYYGTQTGETQVSGCGSTIVVGIANASILGTAVAGSNGAALLEDVPVPGGWANTTVYLQAVELTTCRVSNLVQFTFPPN